jgi:hypothetical protein
MELVSLQYQVAHIYFTTIVFRSMRNGPGITCAQLIKAKAEPEYYGAYEVCRGDSY